MLDKINVYKIVVDHLGTLSDFSSIKEDKKSKTITYYISGRDLLVFFGIPIACSIFLIFMGFKVDSNFSVLIITALSIFAGLLFNLLLLTYDVIKKSVELREKDGTVIKKTDKEKQKDGLLKETYTNISFCILVSIVSIIIVLIYNFYLNISIESINSNLVSYILPVRETLKSIINLVFPFIIYSLLFTFIAHLLMVLKRIYVLFKHEFYTEDTMTRRYKFKW